MGSRIQNLHPREYNGVHYRSTLEMDTAKVLTLLNIPFEYEQQRFLLLEGLKCSYQKDAVRPVHYTPDFIIDNSIIIECKGFETPEWKLKKKLVFRYLIDKRPDFIFYQTKNAKGSLLSCLDNHWKQLGYGIRCISKPTRKFSSLTYNFDSISQAMEKLGLEGKSTGSIVKALTGEKAYVYGYQWILRKL